MSQRILLITFSGVVILFLLAPRLPAPVVEEAAPIEQAKPKSSKSKTVKKESTSAPFDKGAIETSLKALENKWEAGFAAHDPSVIQSIVADDFVGVTWDGQTKTKSGLLSLLKTDSDTYTSAVNETLSVHASSPTTAVVIGTSHEKGTSKNGQPFDRMFRFTDTWVQRNGRWQCTASQVTKIPLQ